MGKALQRGHVELNSPRASVWKALQEHGNHESWRAWHNFLQPFYHLLRLDFKPRGPKVKRQRHKSRLYQFTCPHHVSYGMSTLRVSKGSFEREMRHSLARSLLFTGRFCNWMRTCSSSECDKLPVSSVLRSPQSVHHPHKNHAEYGHCNPGGGVHFAALLGSDNSYTTPWQWTSQAGKGLQSLSP